MWVQDMARMRTARCIVSEELAAPVEVCAESGHADDEGVVESECRKRLCLADVDNVIDGADFSPSTLSMHIVSWLVASHRLRRARLRA